MKNMKEERQHVSVWYVLLLAVITVATIAIAVVTSIQARAREQHYAVRYVDLTALREMSDDDGVLDLNLALTYYGAWCEGSSEDNGDNPIIVRWQARNGTWLVLSHKGSNNSILYASTSDGRLMRLAGSSNDYVVECKVGKRKIVVPSTVLCGLFNATQDNIASFTDM